MFYFAYGSNLCNEQMEKRCPNASFFTKGLLDNYDWIITTRGYANIVPLDNSSIFGKVFNVSESDIVSLDKFEGVDSGSYDRVTVTVQAILNNMVTSINCFTYIDPIVEVGQPKLEYIDRIKNGLNDSDFRESYNKKILRQMGIK